MKRVLLALMAIAGMSVATLAAHPEQKPSQTQPPMFKFYSVCVGGGETIGIACRFPGGVLFQQAAFREGYGYFLPDYDLVFDSEHHSSSVLRGDKPYTLLVLSDESVWHGGPR